MEQAKTLQLEKKLNAIRHLENKFSDSKQQQVQHHLPLPLPLSLLLLFPFHSFIFPHVLPFASLTCSPRLFLCVNSPHSAHLLLLQVKPAQQALVPSHEKKERYQEKQEKQTEEKKQVHKSQRQEEAKGQEKVQEEAASDG